MRSATHTFRHVCAVVLICAAAVSAQQQKGGGPPLPESVRQAQQLMRDGKTGEALALYRQAVQATPDSVPVLNAAGIAFDLAGQYAEARKYFAKSIEVAPDAARKAAQQRSMAMSYAFEGNCKETLKYEQMVIDYYASTGDFFQQGEIANEAARVCIESGDLDAAAKWYKTGHDVGLKQPDIPQDRKDLWEFRWEHAQARIAARRGNKAEAQRHVAAAKAILEKDPKMTPDQAPFFPYLTGYVALYTGDYKTALEELLKANQNDAFIQCLIGQTYEKLGDKEKALEYYRKASATTGHNAPAAFARPFTRKKLG